MGRIMYLMNVDWNWIKQRPHFLVEELSKMGNDVFCVYPISNRKSKLSKNEKSKTINYFGIPRLPKDELSIIGTTNSFIYSFIVKIIIMFLNPSAIIATNPCQFGSWMKKTDIPIYYDCMDNYKEFCDGNRRESIIKQENNLVKISKGIFSSSCAIKEELIKLYKVEESKITVVRNGYNGRILDIEREKNIDHPLRLCYIGTISSWFDFDLLERSLQVNSKIEYYLIGPVDSSIEIKKYTRDRIVYEGIFKHEELYEKIKEYDVLIMPFHVNSIIEMVDPVKLYEYINFNKNIICVYYKEVDRFNPFVYFYNNYSEYIHVLDECNEKYQPKYSNEERIKFLKENTWRQRAMTINEILSK